MLLTTLLCALILGGSMGGAAFADAEVLDEYPSDFTRTVTFAELKDYAVNGDEYVFLDGNDVYKLADNSYQKIDCGDKTVNSVGWSGVFYYTSGEQIYNLDGEPVEADTKISDEFTIGNYHYYINLSDGCINVQDKSSYAPPTPLNGYTNLKNYGNSAYAINENKLYEIKGVTPEICVLNYLDYSQTQNISVGDTADRLKTYNIETPHFVRLNEGAYLTEIAIDTLGDTFTAGNTVKVGEDIEQQTALVLCKTGNSDGITIVMPGKTDGKCYMMRTDEATEITREAVSNDIDENRATATVSKGYMYSSPYVCGMTQLEEINAGDLFEIKGIVKKQVNPELARNFYLIETADGKTGYVPFEYVSLFTYKEEEPDKTVDPDYSEEDEVKTVVLIIIIIALVLIALGYIVFFGTGKKKTDKEDKKKKDKKE